MSILEKFLRAGEGRMLRRLKAVANAVNSIEDDYVDLTGEPVFEEKMVFLGSGPLPIPGAKQAAVALDAEGDAP